jgi:hypothetical protein
MMGHTHGVSKARRPPKKHAQNSIQSEPRLFSVPEAAASVNATGAHKPLGEVEAVNESGAVLAVSAAFVLTAALSAASGVSSWAAVSSTVSPFLGTSPEKSNDSCEGGVHVWSLQLMNVICPLILYFGAVVVNFCVNVTLPSHCLNFISKVLSSMVWGDLFGFRLPTSLTPWVVVHFTLKGSGPSEGLSKEYMCHPLLILAVKVISPLVSSIIFILLVHFTGLRIWAWAMKHSSKAEIKKTDALLSFILY